MPPDPDDMANEEMGYYAAVHGRKDEEQNVLERLGIHQEKKPQQNGDVSRTYTKSQQRGLNYYVPPSPGNQRNGHVSANPGPVTRYTQQNSKIHKIFQNFVCCVRAEPQNADRQTRDAFLPVPKPRRKQRNKAKVAQGTVPPQNETFLQKFLSQNRRLQSRSKGAVLRPTKLSLNHPSPILGIQSPRANQTLLPPPRTQDAKKSCLIVDLDETLVHSSFKPIDNPDFVVPVEIDGVLHKVYVIKRPFVDEFLQKIGEWFECVLFTASLAKYADPVANLLDKWGVFRYRLFREACVMQKGSYIKDLNRLGRDLKRVIILDNSPASYAYHPDNAIPVQSWFDDVRDTELLDLLPFLDRLAQVDNIYHILRRTKDEMGTRRVMRSKRR